MHSDGKDRHSWMPALISAIVAVAGCAALLVMDFGPSNGSQVHGGGMITAAAVSRAGAIELPTAPPDRTALIAPHQNP
jgi:hypothetical protein